MAKPYPGGPLPEEYNRDITNVEEWVEEEETGPEPNYVHTPCGTSKYLDGAHKRAEFAWCEEAESVVRFTRIDR